MKGVMDAKNFRDWGSRPRDAAWALILAILGRSSSGEWLATKMASAWVAPNRDPDLDGCQSVDFFTWVLHLR